MPLKRLELFNFKSYRGSQVIHLGDAPFTCIIGPNGAGKSNLMDAISFVLGVKSAQLRSTQLKDLVYRGRKALQVEGEDGMDLDESEETQATQDGDLVDARSAWVMAVYEDEKAKEWKFKRSIATSGQSTYFLNAKAVPWATYNAQLEKFNILVKAKNFLVFQGDVEGVASQDARALAKLIDRISGSLDLAPQYEAAKLAQDKATTSTIDTHSKRKGLMTEVKHFKEQKEEYKAWERMNEEKDAMIQRHLLWRLYHITNQITESTRQVEEANEKLSGLRKSVDKTDRKLSDAKKEQAQAQLGVKKREGNLKKAEKAYEDKKPEMLAVETQISHAIKKSKNAAGLAEKVERDESRQEEDLKALEKGMKDIERSIKDAAAKQREKSQAAGKTLSKAELDEYRNLRSQANTLAVSERQQIDGLRRELKTLRDGLSSVEDRIAQAERQKAKLTSEIDGLTERDEQMSEKVSELDEERDRIKAQLEHAQAERLRINMKETEINERLQDTYNQLLQAGVDKRETEREAKLKESIASLKRVFPGVLGRVVDLCRAHQSKYDKAIMTVLGRNIDSVVVEHEKTAIECIEYMRNQRLGQATFIPLDTIQVKPIQERLREFRGAKLAVECVEPRSGAERALQFVCGNTLICDNLDVARYVCYEKNADAKAVTLDGTVIHKSGNMTGGQGSGGERKFDDRRVEGLKKLKETYMSQLKDLHQSKPKDNADELLLQNLARLDAEHSIAKDDLDATRLRLTGLRKELKHVESEIKKHTPEREKRTKEVRAAEGKLSALQETIDEADDSVFAAFCKKIKVATIRDYEDIQLRAAREENEVMEKFSQQKARASHQIEFEKNQLASTRERLASLRSTVEKEDANVKKLEKAKQKIEAELEELAGEVERQRGKLQLAAKALEEASEAVDNARDAARKTQKMLDRALKEIAAWNDDIEKGSSDRHAIYRRCRLEEIELPLVKGRLDKVPIEEAARELPMDVDDDETQRPAETDDFGIVPDFDDLEEEDKDNGSEEVGKDFEAQIAKMKTDLEKLVPNMKAIDRLKDVEQGLDEAEREAEAARRETKRAKDEFQDLKKKRCDLFNKAFSHMSDCIDKIYKDLTKSSSATGGLAFLSVEDNDEPYLSGVRYNVMPPGKNFIETEQLSGGEKTMAALALLFSIHSFHPAPFFVLDEVDAALDATNVSKLARYIRHQAEQGVQFLIISLKSSLYERSDGLVGVYREQEENSSRTLTLDLRKYDD